MARNPLDVKFRATCSTPHLQKTEKAQDLQKCSIGFNLILPTLQMWPVTGIKPLKKFDKNIFLRYKFKVQEPGPC